MGITYSDPDTDTDADITDIAALTPSAGDVLYWVDATTRYSTTASQAYGRALLNTASEAAFKDLVNIGIKPVSATDYGFVTGGGNADATANTTALQAALNANYWVQLPEGTAYINTITHTRSNRLSGVGSAATILIRADNQNGRGFFATATATLESLEAVTRGSAYTALDVLTVSGGTGTAATIRVDTVNASGEVLTWTITSAGSYSSPPNANCAVTGGTGSGFTFEPVWTGFGNLWYEGFTLNGNPDNQGSGAHDGIRLVNAVKPIVRDLVCDGWRGLFSGADVGSGIAIIGGYGAELTNFTATDCYDGRVISNHLKGRARGNKLNGNRRQGGITDTASHKFVESDVEANNNGDPTGASLGGGGWTLQDSDYCRLDKAQFNFNKSGAYGGTIQGSDYFVGSNIDASDNDLDGFGPGAASLYCSITNLTASRNGVRGWTHDGQSHYGGIDGFAGYDNADVDFQVFRAMYTVHRRCFFGTGRVYDAGTAASATVAAGGTGWVTGDYAQIAVGQGTFNPNVPLTVQVTATAGVVTGITITDTGDQWTLPPNPVSFTAVSPSVGTSLTLNVTWSGANSETCEGFQLSGAGDDGGTLTIVEGCTTDKAIIDGYAGTIVDEGNNAVRQYRDCLQHPPISIRINKNATDQTGIATTTATKLTFHSSAVFDNGSRWDHANHRWTPGSGAVHLDAHATFDGTTVTNNGTCFISIYKNGSALVHGNFASRPTGTDLGMRVTATDIADENDYYEVYVWGMTGATLTVKGAANYTYFSGHKL